MGKMKDIAIDLANEHRESNQLIAEFMGYTHQSDSAFKDENGFWNDFEVFETWDWLMPVVDKIDEVSNDTTLFKIECNRAFVEDIENYHVFIDVIANSRLEATYKAIVEFIKWYNQNKEDEI